MLVAAFGLLLAPTAHAIDLSVDFGGVDAALACTDPGNCLSTATYTIGPDVPYAVTGAVSINEALLEMSFNLSLVSLIMNQTSGPGQAEFQTMTYSGSGIALDLTDTPPFQHTWAINGAGSAPLGGNVLIDAVAGALPPTALVTGSCATFDVPVSMAAPVCGFTFTFDMDVNPGGSADVQQFKHTMDLTMIPEPGAAVLLGLALAGLAFIRRERA